MPDVELTPVLISGLCQKLRVLSDDNRMRIVLLLRKGEHCVCDIVDELDLPQSLVSHHLAILRGAGLLRDRRSGRWVYYSIDKTGMGDLSALFCEAFNPAGISTEPAPDCDAGGCCDP